MAFAVHIPDENSFPGQLALMDGRPRIDVAQSSLELPWRGGASLNEPVDMCGEGGVVAGIRYQRWLALSLLHPDDYRPSAPANTVRCHGDHSHSARNQRGAIGSVWSAVARRRETAGYRARWYERLVTLRAGNNHYARAPGGSTGPEEPWSSRKIEGRPAQERQRLERQ
jgi:hypothetical protein